MPAGLCVVLYAFKAAPGGGAWVQGRHFTAFGGRGGVLRVGVKKPRLPEVHCFLSRVLVLAQVIGQWVRAWSNICHGAAAHDQQRDCGAGIVPGR